MEKVLESYGIILMSDVANQIEEDISLKSVEFKEALYLVDRLFGSNKKLIKGQLDQVELSECVSQARFQEGREPNQDYKSLDYYGDNSISKVRPEKQPPCYSADFEHR